MLIDSDGKLLKPIQAPPRGEREVEFYQTVFGYETSNPTILKLRQFVPTFYGVKHVVFPDLPFKDILNYCISVSHNYCISVSHNIAVSHNLVYI